MFKNYVKKKLEKLVVKYFKAHPEIKLVCVVGSVGKSSTKMAIAQVLSSQYRVRVEKENHNTEMSAPLAILGIEYPKNPHSILAWLKVFKEAKQKIKLKNRDVDIIVQELGVDRPGDMAEFTKYLKPDVAVVSAITPEHIEFFKNMDNVAKEELAIADASKIVIVNRDDIDQKYASFLQNNMVGTYGNTPGSEYSFNVVNISAKDGMTGYFLGPEIQERYDVSVKLIGEHSARVLASAFAVAMRFNVTLQNFYQSIGNIKPVNGRMNILQGIKGSYIIDDSYNSSPAALKMALDTFYKIQSSHKIAVLGSMNELGASSAEEHTIAGGLCNPNEIDWVVTVGEQANQYLAPAAKNAGCKVKTVRDAISAASFVGSQLSNYYNEDCLILIKGSQGGIFLEETTKTLLHSQSDSKYLVRQSPAWKEAKMKFFSNL